jgi:mono/diheme cytochrome c family protein
MFSSPLAGDPATLPAMPDPMAETADLGSRARAYLHTNCSQCHQPGGPTPTSLDLRYTTSLAETAACDADPQSGNLGIDMALIIAPGDAARSVLVARMNVRDTNAMPPLGSTVIDEFGVTLVSDWINGLASCN